jgi:clan AA aspartic protease (TIGR02281 family)
MRHRFAILTTACLLLAGGCVSVPPEQAERDALAWTAARECEARVRTVRVRRVDQYGRIHAEYAAPSDWRVFSECYQIALKRELDKRPLGAGRPARPGSGATTTTAPVQLAGSGVLVPVAVNGKRAVLLLDTGASQTILSPRTAERLGIPVSITSPKVLATIVGGGLISMPYVRLASLQIGEFAIESIDVGVYEALPQTPEIDGLLGANFLNHFKLTVDRENRQLMLEASREAAAADTQAPSSNAVTPGIVWQVPSWSVGDEWSFRWESPSGKGTFVWTVGGEESIDDVGHYVVRSGSRTIYYTKSDLAVRIEKVGGTVVVRHTPGFGLDWPLHVGKRWEQTYTRENLSARQTAQWYRQCSVVEEQPVAVPAGTFTTLHVVCRDRLDNLKIELWYAPEAKHWVRERSVLPFGVRVRELVSYKLRSP